MTRRIVTITLICCSLILTACNTIGGLGRDIESVGDTIEDAAE